MITLEGSLWSTSYTSITLPLVNQCCSAATRVASPVPGSFHCHHLSTTVCLTVRPSYWFVLSCSVYDLWFRANPSKVANYDKIKKQTNHVDFLSLSLHYPLKSLAPHDHGWTILKHKPLSAIIIQYQSLLATMHLHSQLFAIICHQLTSINRYSHAHWPLLPILFITADHHWYISSP